MKHLRVMVAAALAFGALAALVLVLPFGDSKTKAIVDVPVEMSISVLCGTDWSCYPAAIIDTMGEGDVDKGIDILLKLEEETKGFGGACHTIAHSVGAQAYGKFADKALITRAEICDWGYGHGVMVSASQRLATPDFITTFTDYCRSIMGTNSASGCTHGIGHALAESKQPLDLSVEVCQSISAEFDKDRRPAEPVLSKTHLNSCVEGWAMQSGGAHAWHEMTTPDQADAVCEGIDGVARAVCSSMSVRNYVTLEPDRALAMERLQQFADWCQQGQPGSAYGIECARYLGEASDDLLFDSSKPIDHELIANGIQRYCAGVTGSFCTNSFVFALVNRVIGTAEFDPQGRTTADMTRICALLPREPWGDSCTKTSNWRLGLTKTES